MRRAAAVLPVLQGRKDEDIRISSDSLHTQTDPRRYPRYFIHTNGRTPTPPESGTAGG